MPRTMCRRRGDAARHRAFDAELLTAPDDELVDIAVIVGEQYPGLHVAPMGAGIMQDALEGIIHPDRIEHSKRQGLAGHVVPIAIGDFIAHQIKAAARGNGGRVRQP